MEDCLKPFYCLPLNQNSDSTLCLKGKIALLVGVNISPLFTNYQHRPLNSTCTHLVLFVGPKDFVVEGLEKFQRGLNDQRIKRAVLTPTDSI